MRVECPACRGHRRLRGRAGPTVRRDDVGYSRRGTACSVGCAARGNCVRVVYVSSTGVYAQDAGEWVDEASVCEPVREGGRACLSGERLLFAHAHGRDAIVLRLAGLYGQDGSRDRPTSRRADRLPVLPMRT